jgi:hypothetical protein
MYRLFLETVISEKGKTSIFGAEFIFVSRFYSRFLSNIRIPNLSKILIEIVEPPQKEHFINTYKLTRVASVRKYFEWKNLEDEISENSRFRIILEFIHATVLEMCGEFGWPIDVFNEANAEIIRSNFHNEFTLLSSKASKDRRLSASVKILATIDHCSIFLEASAKDDATLRKRIPLIECNFYEDDFSILVKTFRWENNDSLIVSNRDKEIHFKVSLDAGYAEMVFTPHINSLDYLVEDVKLLSPYTPSDEKDQIYENRLKSLGINRNGALARSSGG